MPNTNLGLLIGGPFVDLEKNRRIKYPSVRLLTMTSALWLEWRELVNIV